MQQWRVTFYEEGEEPIVEVVSSFDTAWALSRPCPEEAHLEWALEQRSVVTARFQNESVVCVAYVDLATRNVIEKIEGEATYAEKRSSQPRRQSDSGNGLPSLPPPSEQ